MEESAAAPEFIGAMTNHYMAFGLELRASFLLPGMVSGETGGGELPSLELELTTPEELQRAWSGADGPPEWRGRLGDGLDLAIERERTETCSSATARGAL